MCIRDSLNTSPDQPMGCSDGSRGVIGGGYVGSPQNVMDYITIANTGNATDFGDLSVAKYGGGGTSGD